MSTHQISTIEALVDAQEIALSNPSTILIGEGVTDPKRIFNTTKGLKEKFPSQVFEMPVSEAGMTGIMIGAAINKVKPIITHQRIDFTLYTMDQIVNNAAKWYSMFGGQRSVPLVIRTVIGRGWGQGNQHSQNLATLYAHIPGLKVVMPSGPINAKGLLLQALIDPNPVIFIEHRWIHNVKEHVPQGHYTTPFKAKVYPGDDITIVASGFAFQEAKLAREHLLLQGIYPELIDLQSLKPIDYKAIKYSLLKTKHLLVVDDSWRTLSLASEIITLAAEDEELDLQNNPIRLTYPDFPSPSTHALTRHYYTSPVQIMEAVGKLLHKPIDITAITKLVAQRTDDIDPFINKLTSAI